MGLTSPSEENTARIKSLAIFLLLVTALSAGFILLMLQLGQKGYYLAQLYMMGPAMAAILTRAFFYDLRFKDAHLRLGKLRSYLQFWGITLAIVALSYAMYTVSFAVSWDLSGDTFLRQLEKQMQAAGQDIHDLPSGMTPRLMLILFFVGGLTIFNVPTILTGFGEEFGWRGLMFPLFYRLRPWMGFVLGGLIWFAWHVPLVMVFPENQTRNFTPWEHVANIAVLATGSICAFTFFAFVFIKTGSIWVASFSHAVFNNAGRAGSYFATVDHPLRANLALMLTMAMVVAFLWRRGHLKVFGIHFGGGEGATPTAA